MSLAYESDSSVWLESLTYKPDPWVWLMSQTKPIQNIGLIQYLENGCCFGYYSSIA